MLSIKNLSVHFGDRTLFDNINLTIKTGERVSLVGRNGVGKSTLFRLINRQITPDSGTIEYSKDIRIGLLEQDLDNFKDFSVRSLALTAFPEIEAANRQWKQLETAMMNAQTDDEMMRISGKMADLSESQAHSNASKVEGEAEKILKGLGFLDEDMERPVVEFSGGWQMRVLLARLLLMQPDYLLLDEPTNHLDIVSVIWLEQYLKEYQGTYIVISHDKRFLNSVSEKIIELDRANAQVYVGDYDHYLSERVLQREILENSYKNQQAEIERKERLIDKYRAKASKAKTAKALQSELNRMDRIDLGEGDAKDMVIRFPKAPRSAERIIEARRLSHAYGDNQVLSDLDFEILRGQKISLIGQNGQGKTTLARIITRKLKQSGGTCIMGPNTELRYFAQDQGEQIEGDATVLEWLEHQATVETRSQVRNVLGAFLFSQEDVDKKVKVLSGGERSRLAMAAMILQPMNFLILDEPTNHLDLQSKEVLKSAIQKYDGALLVISHDRDFLKGLSQDTFVLHDGRLTHHLGDVDSFLEKQGFDSLISFSLSNKSVVDKSSKTPSAERNPNREQQNIERKVKQIEEDIARTEKEMKKLEIQMAQEGFYEQEGSQRILSNYDVLKSQLENHNEAWIELAEKLETL